MSTESHHPPTQDYTSLQKQDVARLVPYRIVVYSDDHCHDLFDTWPPPEEMDFISCKGRLDQYLPIRYWANQGRDAWTAHVRTKAKQQRSWPMGFDMCMCQAISYVQYIPLLVGQSETCLYPVWCWVSILFSWLASQLTLDVEKNNHQNSCSVCKLSELHIVTQYVAILRQTFACAAVETICTLLGVG